MDGWIDEGSIVQSSIPCRLPRLYPALENGWIDTYMKRQINKSTYIHTYIHTRPPVSFSGLSVLRLSGHIPMYVCMYVCMYVMYVCMDGCDNEEKTDDKGYPHPSIHPYIHTSGGTRSRA